MATLAQLRTSLQARGYGTDTAAVQTECINAAYREVCGDHHWSWLEKLDATLVTAVGTGIVSLATITDLLHLMGVRLTFPSTGTPREQYDLRYLSLEAKRSQEYAEEWDLAGRLATPEVWAPLGVPPGELQLLPAADRVYKVTLDYIKDPADLAADGDIPVIPLTYHDILVEGGLAEMAARHRDWAQHDRYRARFEYRLRRMKSETGIRQQQTSLQVQRSGFYGDRYPAGSWYR